MPNSNMFPEEGYNKNTNTDESGAPPTIFDIGGIKLPEGNKLAIWLLVVVVIGFMIFFYFFMKVIDKVVDKALKPEEAKTEQVLQEDYNKLLETAKILEAENEYLRDSLATQPEEIRKRTDSAIYSETKPYINQLYKNRKR